MSRHLDTQVYKSIVAVRRKRALRCGDASYQSKCTQTDRTSAIPKIILIPLSLSSYFFFGMGARVVVVFVTLSLVSSVQFITSYSSITNIRYNKSRKQDGSTHRYLILLSDTIGHSNFYLLFLFIFHIFVSQLIVLRKKLTRQRDQLVRVINTHYFYRTYCCTIYGID